MNCLLFVAVFVAHRLCCSNGEQLLYGGRECSFSLFLFTSSGNSYPLPRLLPPVFSSTHSPRQCDNLSLLLFLFLLFQRLNFNLLCFPTISFSICFSSNLSFSLSLALRYRQNNLFTRLRMKWSRVHCWHCMQRGPDTFPRTRSKPRCKEANIKATSTRAATRTRAQFRDFRVTVRPRRSLTAQRCVIMWKDHNPRLEEKVGR